MKTDSKTPWCTLESHIFPFPSPALYENVREEVPDRIEWWSIQSASLPAETAVENLTHEAGLFVADHFPQTAVIELRM